MGRYANQTTVSTAKSREEIERILVRYGADAFAYAGNAKEAAIQFQIDRRLFNVRLPLPNRRNEEFTHTPARGNPRHPEDAERLWEKACRQRWRALALVIKAKLEAVECGISTIEQEFLAWTVLPGGKTVHQQLAPEIDRAIESGQAPLLQIGAGE